VAWMNPETCLCRGHAECTVVIDLRGGRHLANLCRLWFTREAQVSPTHELEVVHEIKSESKGQIKKELCAAPPLRRFRGSASARPEGVLLSSLEICSVVNLADVQDSGGHHRRALRTGPPRIVPFCITVSRNRLSSSTTSGGMLSMGSLTVRTYCGRASSSHVEKADSVASHPAVNAASMPPTTAELWNDHFLCCVNIVDLHRNIAGGGEHGFTGGMQGVSKAMGAFLFHLWIPLWSGLV
jgi:hypothetical protein